MVARREGSKVECGRLEGESEGEETKQGFLIYSKTYIGMI